MAAVTRLEAVRPPKEDVADEDDMEDDDESGGTEDAADTAADNASLCAAYKGAAAAEA